MAISMQKGSLAIRYRTKDNNGQHLRRSDVHLHGMGEKWRPLAISLRLQSVTFGIGTMTQAIPLPDPSASFGTAPEVASVVLLWWFRLSSLRDSLISKVPKWFLMAAARIFAPSRSFCIWTNCFQPEIGLWVLLQDCSWEVSQEQRSKWLSKRGGAWGFLSNESGLGSAPIAAAAAAPMSSSSKAWSWQEPLMTHYYHL